MDGSIGSNTGYLTLGLHVSVESGCGRVHQTPESGVGQFREGGVVDPGQSRDGGKVCFGLLVVVQLLMVAGLLDMVLLGGVVLARSDSLAVDVVEGSLDVLWEENIIFD